MSPGNGPLTGLKVVEITHVMAGPVCGLMLADMGAEVIKVERPPAGDATRSFVPPEIDGQSAAFMMVNRNKRGIAVNPRSPEGREVLRRLIAKTDVVIENFRKGVMEKMGLGYDVLSADNPGLIYCAISGFGRTGPYAGRGGFDLIAQGMSGLMSITGEGEGRPPVKVGAPLTDITAGILAAMGIAAAYAERQKTGRGQMVDTSLFEAGIVQTYWQSAIALAGGTPQPMGSAHPLSAPYQAFETSDGWITLGAANQANWLRLVELLGADELVGDARFSDNSSRLANREALADLLAPHFKARSTDHWLGRLEDAHIPAGPVLSISEMHQDPQARARGMVTETEHPTAGTVETLGPPVKFSRTPGGVRHGAPVYGQHTREVLLEIGYGAEEIDRLIADGAVSSPGSRAS